MGWAFTGSSSSGFAFEILFRMYDLGAWQFISHKKYQLDVFLVVLNIFDSLLNLASGAASGLILLRVLRIFRIVKMFRIVTVIEDLHLIVVGLVSALKFLRNYRKIMRNHEKIIGNHKKIIGKT